MKTRTNLAHDVHRHDEDPDPLLDEFDELVREAAAGNRRALGAIAIALGGRLHAVAVEALGPAYRDHAGDVVQELFEGLCDKRFPFPRIRGAAWPWLRRTVRAIAQRHRRDSALPEDAAE
jgi:DNA-directed RNA polymerase specialized sigma24 family protein